MLSQLLAKKTDFSGTESPQGVELRRTLGPWGLTALGIGEVMGGGLFVITCPATNEHT